MHNKIFHSLLTLAATGLLFSGCKKWQDHNAITDNAVDKNLFQQISENSNLTKFAELLTRSGKDKLIASSKTFTVFAPTNNALTTLDAAIVNDSAKLSQFILNHITTQSYYTTQVTVQSRLAMLSGKYNNMLGKTFEDASIVTADQYAKNGVLQVIDKMMPVLPNIWEVMESNTQVPAKQKTYLQSLYRNVFDATNAVQIGVDPNSGKPIYKPGTDSVRSNTFWLNVYDLRRESGQYTFFILADVAWDAEVLKYKPYFATGTTDSTTNLASWEVVKDFAVPGVYTAGNIPDTVLSRFETKVGVEKPAIVQSIKTSNGIVHIMSKLAVTPKHKFKQYIIEAENYRSSSADRRSVTYFRDKYNPVTGKNFRDVLVYNHGLALFNLGYRITNAPSMKYRAYWVAVHDNINGLTSTFTQKLGIGTYDSGILPYVTVALNNYNEVLLGEFTLSAYTPILNLYLTAANSTTATANPLVCDYIRIEPVL